MRYPQYIKSGDTIGFVAPAFGCNIEPYKSSLENAIKKLGEKGYKADVGPNAYSDCGIGISNTPEKCGEELTNYYCSDNNQMLMSCGGGELMCETISQVDFEKIKAAKPKWYTGYSDNTNFSFLLTTMCDTAAIYGAGACNFGMEPWHQSVTDTFNILEGKQLFVENYDKWEKEKLRDEEHPLLPYNCTEPSIIHAYNNNGNEINEISFSGRLVGGCMDCLVNITGTRHDHVAEFLEKYKEDGFIWFLESCDLNIFSMRRAMWQMYESGWFKYCKGMLIGRPLHFKEEFMGLDQYEAILYYTRKLNIPVIMDLDIGHISPMMPIITGSLGEVNYKNNKLTLKYKLA